MTPPPLPVGVIGGGRHGAALAEHQAPLPDTRIARWAASPGGADLSAVREFAARAGAPFAREWEAVARDPELRAVLVLGEAGSATAAAEAALTAGKAVFCAAPAATRTEDANRLAGAASGGRGGFLTGGTVRLSPAGRAALGLIGRTEFGAVQSVFASVRLPAPGNGDRLSGAQRAALDDAGWDLLDFVSAAVPAQPVRVHAYVDGLFGPAAMDTAVCIIRYDNEVVATIDVARCLPAPVAVSADGDVEVEVIGAREAVRLEPGATAVRVYGTGAPLRPWVDAPVVAMLGELAGVASEGPAAAGETGRAGEAAGRPPAVPVADGVTIMRRSVELMEAIRAASARPAARP